MTKAERYGVRDLTYSAWHRTLDSSLTYCDLDGLEYCRKCKQALALIETAWDIGQNGKFTEPLVALARQADIPAYLVFYEVREHVLTKLRVRPLWPEKLIEREMWPTDFEAMLLLLRDNHSCV